MLERAQRNLPKPTTEINTFVSPQNKGFTKPVNTGPGAPLTNTSPCRGTETCRPNSNHTGVLTCIRTSMRPEHHEFPAAEP